MSRRRIHLLSLQLLKHVFFDAARDTIKHSSELDPAKAAQQGRVPLVAFGVAVAGVRIWSARVIPLHAREASASMSVIDPFLAMWREDDWLRGFPDAAVVEPDALKNAGDAWKDLERYGIEIQPATGEWVNEYFAKMEVFQCHAQSAWIFPSEDLHPTMRDISLSHFNECLRADLQKLSQPTSTVGARSAEIRSYLRLPIRTTEETHEVKVRQHSIDEWLHGTFGRNLIELINDPKQPGRPFIRYDYWGCLWGSVEIEGLLPAWPETLEHIAAEFDIQLEELKRYVDGIPTLPVSKAQIVLALFQIRENYFQTDAAEALGPYILVSKNMRAAKKAFEEAAHGGDLDYAGVLVPRKPFLRTAPWHIVMFEACGGLPSFLLLDRSTIALTKAQRRMLINVATDDIEIPVALYEELVRDLISVLTDVNRRRDLLMQIARGEKHSFIRRTVGEEANETGRGYYEPEDDVVESDVTDSSGSTKH